MSSSFLPSAVCHQDILNVPFCDRLFKAKQKTGNTTSMLCSPAFTPNFSLSTKTYHVGEI